MGDDDLPCAIPARRGTPARLGEHPYARELASLGLPKRPLVSGFVGHVEMTFGDGHVLR